MKGHGLGAGVVMVSLMVFGFGPTAVADPLAGGVDLDMVCALGETGRQDWTLPTNDGTASDTPLAYSTAIQFGFHLIYWGMDEPFSGLLFDIGQPGTDPSEEREGNVWWYYFDGEFFTRLTLTSDTTDNYHNAGPGAISFVPPEDWAPSDLWGEESCPGDRYYLLSATHDSYLLSPLARQVSAIV